MTDRDDIADLVASARSVTKSSAFHFNGRIRFENKGERLLCMDAVRIYICSVKIPVKVIDFQGNPSDRLVRPFQIEHQFNILTIRLIDRVNDSHIVLEGEEKQVYAFHGLYEKSSLQPFLLVLIRNLHAVFPHRLTSIIDIRPDNEYDRLLRQVNEMAGELNITSTLNRPCGGYSLRYECACDLYQIPVHRSVQHIIDTVFAHRLSREFTFREMESYPQKEWLPMLTALRHNDWFRKLIIENVKLSSENSDEICNVARLCSGLQELKLIDCGLRHDFCSKFAPSFALSHIEHLDLSNNHLEDKGINALSSSLSQRKFPLRSIYLQSCSISQKSLYSFHTGLTTNSIILKNLQILNLTGNRIKEENCLTLLFSNPDNVLEEFHLSDVEFSLEAFFHSLATLSCKLRRLHIYSTKPSSPPSISGGVKLFFSKNATLEILQIANANLSNDFLRELCEGLQSNNRLSKIDLRLQGNPLESFLRENAARLASIPSLTALDISACDADNELITLLTELKKNHKLKTLHLGRNFNNVKTKNLPKVIAALKDLIWEDQLEYLSLADSRLKDSTADVLLSIISNTSLQTLDLRGNGMGDTGVRILARLLRINRHLKTIYFDRNLLSLNNLEEIIDAMEENSIIQYLPVPIFDIVLMKTTEKERMEKLQQLLSKLDTICTRNQQARQTIYPSDSLTVIPTGHLTRETNLSWELQQQLIGDQASLEYIASCAPRSVTKIEESAAILTRTGRLAQIHEQLNEIYLAEEGYIQEQLQALTRKFEEIFRERNERMAKRITQLYKEKVQLPVDEKFHGEVRHCLARMTESMEELIQDELPVRLMNQSRQCFTTLVTSLQKRAYETNNEYALDTHKTFESAMFPPVTDSPSQGHSSTLDRLVSRGTNVINRITHKQTPTLNEPTDDSAAPRGLRKADSNEALDDRSPKPPRAASSNREPRLLSANPTKGPAPLSPKLLPASSRRSVLYQSNEPEIPPKPSESVYSNVPVISGSKKSETPTEDDGESIANDLLDIVQQEEKRDQQQQQRTAAVPPPIPAKLRSVSSTQEPSLDIEVEPSTKLIHPAKDRPRRANISRPARRGTNGASQDSSSDGGLDIDEPVSAEPQLTAPPFSTAEAVQPVIETATNESSNKAVGKLVKNALKQTESSALPPPVPAKLQSRPSVPIPTAPKSNPLAAASEPIVIFNSDAHHETGSSKSSITGNSGFTSLQPPIKEENHPPTENVATPTPPPVSARPNKTAIGTRVLPVLDSNGEAPAVKLRPLPTAEKKAEPPPNSETHAADSASGSADPNEEYKRMSVKERARMLANGNVPIASNDKKLNTPPNNQTIQ